MYTHNSKHQQISTERLQYIHDIIENRKGRGKQVPLPVRNKMERLFGRNFSDVRIHEGPEASLIGAKAFTYGNDIYFAEGMYDPCSEWGQRLLAHELTHVVQQLEGQIINLRSNRIAIVNDEELEKKADIMAMYVNNPFLFFDNRSFRQFYCHKAVSVNPATPVIQCLVEGRTTRSDLFKKLKIINLYFKNTVTEMTPDIAIYLDYILKDTRVWGNIDLRGIAEITINNYITQLRKTRIRKTRQSTINIDHIKNKSFTELRREQLKGLDSDLYLSEQYGLRTTIDKSTKMLGLRIQHKNGTWYLRSDHTTADDIFLKLVPKSWIELDDCNYFIVNSLYVKNKLKRLTNPLLTDDDISFNLISECIFRMAVKVKGRSDDAKNTEKKEIEKAIKFFGATPSSFQAIKELSEISRFYQTEDENYIYLDIKRKKDLDTTEDNDALLENIKADSGFVGISEIVRHGTGDLILVYKCIIKLITGLDAFKTNTKFTNNLVVKSALQSINNILKTLSVSQNNTLHVTRLYELLMDELHLILATVHPYAKEEYEALVKEIYRYRIPALNNPQHNFKGALTISIESSGMGAISTALIAASGNDNTEKKIRFVNQKVDYYEVLLELVENSNFKIADPEDEIEIIYSTLNPSTLMNEAYSEADIVRTVKDELDGPENNLTLIIDITVEIDEGENGQLNYIVSSLGEELKAGKLNIILAKSYQKYASLGSARIMSGAVIAINNGKSIETNQFIEYVSTQNDFIILGENQLMIFILNNASNFEIELINKAAKNAEYANTLWNVKPAEKTHTLFADFSGFLNHLPFLMRIVRTPRHPGPYSKALLDMLGFEFRDSFSFLNTSYVVITPDVFRITVGQESKERLTEKIYGLGYISLKSTAMTTFDNATLTILSEEILRIREANPELKHNKIASIVHLSYYLFFNKENSCDEILKFYENFLKPVNNLLENVTTEMEQTLSMNWLKLIFHANLNANLTDVLINKLNVITKKIPAYRLALFFIELDNDFFNRQSNAIKNDLVNIFLNKLGIESMLTVCWQLISRGHMNKVKYLPNLMKNLYPNKYVLTANDKARMDELTTLIHDQDIDSIIDIEYASSREFLTKLKTIATINQGKRNEVLSIAKKVTINPGLLSEKIATTIYFGATERVNQIQQKIRNFYKFRFTKRSNLQKFRERMQIQNEINTMFAELKKLKIAKINAANFIS